jgi:hypothetical protein
MKHNGWKIALIVGGVLLGLLLVLAVLVTIGASFMYQTSSKEMIETGGSVENYYDESFEMAPEAAADVSEQADVSEHAMRKIIVSASLSLEVKKLPESVSRTEKLVAEQGGYLESVNFTTYSDASRRADLILRVPADKFDAVMNALRDIAIGVSNESINRADVTMEYVDIEARLANMQEHEAALRTLWNKATDIEDMIKIEGELARVRGEIESLTARKKVMDNQIQLATISVFLSEQPSSLPANVKGEGLGKQAYNSLLRSVQLIKYSAGLLVIIVAGLLPIIALAAVIGLVVWYFIRRKKNRAAAALKKTDT